MKKIWNVPAIEVLDVGSTFGGPIYTNDADSEIYLDREKNKWVQDYGS